jgi:hypothetical protein
MTENNGGYRIDAGRIVAASFVSRQDRDLKVWGITRLDVTPQEWITGEALLSRSVSRSAGVVSVQDVAQSNVSSSFPSVLFLLELQRGMDKQCLKFSIVKLFRFLFDELTVGLLRWISKPRYLLLRAVAL